MRRFGTQGPVHPEKNYVVSRATELADFVMRVKEGRYIVIFAPRQTGKTTFFQRALDVFTAEEPAYFPISLNFEVYEDCPPSVFYDGLYEDLLEVIGNVFTRRGEVVAEALTEFLETAEITDHLSMGRFFRNFSKFLGDRRVILIIDEFDGIPKEAVTGFLHSLRRIYVSNPISRCPHSVDIVGVKSITQLNYDRSISPFNIQDEFNLPNFTLEQVQELLGQYVEEVGQQFAPAVIESIHKQTAGQPVLVNRFAQILTEELDIPKTEPITRAHFSTAHTQLLRGRNTNIEHLTTNIRRNPRFESVLMRIMARDEGVDFNLDDHIISELATYGVIKEGADGMCEILNPIYLYRIMRTFKPLINGLEQEYFPEDTSDVLHEYLTSTGQIEMEALLDNFRNFIARAGFRILQVPDTPQESVGRHLLLAYLDEFVRRIGGVMHIEVQTGRGRMDILITHNQRKYIIETKIWRGDSRYQAGKKQLAAYLKLEGTTQGYYIVFDHRQEPESRVETETIDDEQSGVILFLLYRNRLQVKEYKMPYCTVCKIETDYEYDIALSNGEYLHYSCILMLQMQKHEIESVLRKQKPQFMVSLFAPTEIAQQDIASEAEIEDLRAKIAKLASILDELYDYLPSWPPDWEERKRMLIRENGSICSHCDKEADVYLLHDIPIFEGGTNALDNLSLICAECYRSLYREADIFGTSTLKSSQSEFSEPFSEIQSAIENNQKIQFDYKKPSDRRWTTRVVIPERLFNIPNSRESGETLCVEGFCELRQDTRVFALERMQGLVTIED